MIVFKSTILFLFLNLINANINLHHDSISEIDHKMEVLTKFCVGKTENFCSKDNLKSMFTVLELQRLKELKKAK